MKVPTVSAGYNHNNIAGTCILIRHYNDYKKLIFYYIVLPKRVTSGRARFRGLAPRQRIFKETSQRCQAFGNIVLDLNSLGIEPTTSRCKSDVFNLALTGRFQIDNICSGFEDWRVHLLFRRTESGGKFWSKLQQSRCKWVYAFTFSKNGSDGRVVQKNGPIRWPSGTEKRTDQTAEWHRASASGSVDLGFDFESGQTNDLKIGIYSFPAWRSGTVWRKPANLLVMPLVKALYGIPPS